MRVSFLVLTIFIVSAASAQTIETVGEAGQAAPAPANGSIAGALTPEDVLSSSIDHFPKILESLAARRAARGDALAARGAFDLVFEAEGFGYATGFYDSSFAGGTLSQRVAPLGARVFGGYRLSDGDFPIYEDEYFTNQGGEAKIGVLFSLLRDRAIDKERFAIVDSQLAAEQADLEVLLTEIGVQHKALRAYWRWTWAGRQLAVYEDLLRIAEERQSGLQQQVEAGAVARIFLTENQQNIARRRRFVAEAERDLLTAANSLSFYYRDEDGRPVIPQRERLPGVEFVLARAAAADGELGDAPRDPQAVMSLRPELRILRAAIERAQRKIQLTENETLPRLDLTAEVSHDFGAIAEGGVSRNSTDTIFGFRFTVPFQRREAAGRLARAEAELQAAEQRRRATEDELTISLQNVFVRFAAAQALTGIARREFEQSVAMRDAERERFLSGASDFFVVNVREETAADARIQYYGAAVDALLAEADYSAAILDLDRFLISPR